MPSIPSIYSFVFVLRNKLHGIGTSPLHIFFHAYHSDVVCSRLALVACKLTGFYDIVSSFLLPSSCGLDAIALIGSGPWSLG